MRIQQWQIFVLAVVIVLGIFAYTRARYSRTSPQTHSPLAQHNFERLGGPRLYPDLRHTPGATNPAVTQSTISQTVCLLGWTKTVRPPYVKTHRIKLQIMEESGAVGSPGEYELDHFIPLELGGCPDCIENLWLEPYAPEPGAHQKDEVKNYLHKRVCDGSMTLDEAQRAITSDWYKVYLEIHDTQVSK